jgi:hypothetical protein
LRGKKECQFVLIALLIVSQVYSGLLTSVSAADDEHSYIIFQDDFEDGEHEDWTIFVAPDSPLGSTWAIELEDGNHFFSQTGHHLALAGDDTWNDYTFEVKVKLIDAIVVNIIFRSSAAGEYRLNYHQNRLRLMKETQGINSELIFVDQSLSLNTWHPIKIICVENSINIYVDDVLKLSYVDEEDPHLYGKFGFEFGNYYDDVKVSTTHSFYVSHLIKEVEDEIIKERIVGTDTLEAEEKWFEAQDAFDNGNLSGAESLAKEALDLAQHAPMGVVSVNDLLNYPTTYNKHTVEISGTLKGIQYEQGLYRFAVDDGIAAISVTFDGTLEEIANEDDIKVVGTFDSLTESVSASKVEKITSPQPSPTQPEPTEPEPTEPEPTEPAPTEPTPTEPEPTEPTPTEPEPI